ncbi:hypothetical protein DQM68_18295 [Leptospira mayottensis]|nr:hypothetical protein DQM68_18295 [Leptospira mayottensis]AZQ04022.1 hypothetical protein LEP1GSC190_18370 [Leptospira mayottensis 200901116]TGM89700.1 hypothetical protein EHR03_18600 [Leptospira mayottensis]
MSPKFSESFWKGYFKILKPWLKIYFSKEDNFSRILTKNGLGKSGFKRFFSKVFVGTKIMNVVLRQALTINNRCQSLFFLKDWIP